MKVAEIVRNSIKYDVLQYTRGGTKSPTMWVLVDTLTGRRYTPYAQRHYNIRLNLNDIFKILYGKMLRDFVSSGITLLSKIPKEIGYSSPFHVPVILGKEHGVVFGEKEEEKETI